MPTYGADVAELRALAERLERGAGELDAARAALREAIDRSVWTGPDGDELRARWSSEIERALASTGATLTSSASTVRANADAQEQASTVGSSRTEPGSGGGGSGSGSGSSGGGTGGVGGVDGDEQPTAPAVLAAVGVPGHLVPDTGDELDDLQGTEHQVATDEGRVTWDEDGYTIGQRETFRLEGAEGGSGFEVSGEASVQAEASGGYRVEDGYTVYTVGAGTEFSAGGGAEITAGGWRLGAEAGVSLGARGETEVWVPDGTEIDLTQVDLTDPTNLPPGTRVVVDGEAYVGTEGSGNFWWLKGEGSVEEAVGVRTQVERLDGDVVRITAGDTESLEYYTGLGLEHDGYGISFGTANDIGSASMASVELDLSTAEGRAAYEAFLETGAIPQDASTGISAPTVYDTFDTARADRFGISLPGIEYQNTQGQSSSTITTVTHPDGTQDFVGQVAQAGGIELSFGGHLDAAGVQDASANTYTLAFAADDLTQNALTTPAAPIADVGAVAEGSMVQLSFTQAEAAELQRLVVDSVGQDYYPGDPFYELAYAPSYDGDPFANPRSPDEVLSQLLSQSGSSSDMLNNLSIVLARTGQDMPGTVSVGGP